MLLAGDEFGRTQHGNNNAYCQDNEISWLDWKRADDARGAALLDFTARMIALRHRCRRCARRLPDGGAEVAAGPQGHRLVDQHGQR